MPKSPGSEAIAIRPQLIVGLGNPESCYDRTRHNIGFEAVDVLAQRWGLTWTEQRRFNALLAEGPGPAGKIRLLKPLTYMNRSGQAIRAVLDWFKLPPESVLIVYDDMDLPLGRLRLRQSGSAGGHNGIKSTIAHLNTQDFPRLRLGIGKPRVMGGETVSHVLGKFTPAEAEIVAQTLDLATEAIALSLRESVHKAMSLYNNRCVGQNDDKTAAQNPQNQDRASGTSQTDRANRGVVPKSPPAVNPQGTAEGERSWRSQLAALQNILPPTSL
jgi:peptidyl-tRNA hydrolase, PTH1 family